jgi:hypothetical protein
MSRVLSRVRVVRSEESRMESLADPSNGATSTRGIRRAWRNG